MDSESKIVGKVREQELGEGQDLYTAGGRGCRCHSCFGRIRHSDLPESDDWLAGRRRGLGLPETFCLTLPFSVPLAVSVSVSLFSLFSSLLFSLLYHTLRQSFDFFLTSTLTHHYSPSLLSFPSFFFLLFVYPCASFPSLSDQTVTSWLTNTCSTTL